MSRIKTFTNGGTLLASDLNSIQDDYEFAFSTYKSHVIRVGGSLGGATAGNPFVLPTDADLSAIQVGSGGGFAFTFYFDPADYAISSRVTKGRLRVAFAVGSTAPTVNFTFGLYPVATWGASSAPTIGSVGTVVTGSTVAFNTPAANSQAVGTSSEFIAPTAGWYVIAYAVNGTTAGGAFEAAEARLQVRQV